MFKISSISLYNSNLAIKNSGFTLILLMIIFSKADASAKQDW